MYETPKLKLNADLQKRLDDAVVERWEEAVASCKDRDDLLRGYRDQLEGVSQPAGVGPWDGACQLDDPITLQHFLTRHAKTMGSYRGDDWIHVEALDPKNQESAKKLEQAIAIRGRMWNVKPAVYDASWNSHGFPVAPMYVGWKQTYAKLRMTGYQDEMGDVVEQEDVERTPVPMVKLIPKYTGPDLRTVEPYDLYLDPPNAPSIDAAERVGERIYHTAASLITAIDEQQYDQEAVEKLFKAGPQWLNMSEAKKDADEADGISGDHTTGYWECFQIVGSMPIILEDGKLATPKHLLNEEFVWVICPEAKVVLKWEPCPYTFKPYVDYHMLRKPGRRMGRCIPDLLEPLQEEGTANMRFGIDCKNLMANPVTKWPESYMAKRHNWSLRPGGRVPYPDAKGPDSIQAMQWDMRGVDLTNQTQEMIWRRSNELISAVGVDSLRAPGVPGEDPTATQVNMVSGNVSLKDDLYLQVFNEGIEAMMKRIVAMWLQHMSPDGEALLYSDEGEELLRIMPEDLEKEYRFIPSANSDAANPQVRMAKVAMSSQAQMMYFQTIATLPPDKWQYFYHSARRALEENGERNIEAWIGREPQGVDPMLLLQMVIQMLQQAAQVDPVAAQILMQVQQAAMGGTEGGTVGGQSPQNASQGQPMQQGQPSMNGAGSQGEPAYAAA